MSLWNVIMNIICLQIAMDNLRSVPEATYDLCMKPNLLQNHIPLAIMSICLFVKLYVL